MILTQKNDFLIITKFIIKTLKILFLGFYSSRITPVTMAIESSSVFASSKES